MKCQLCGNQNLEDAQFCGRCGTSLSTSTPIGVGASSSEPPTGSLPKTIKRNHHRRIKPWMWIVSGVVGLLVVLWVGFGLMFTGALGCPEFLGCQDWGQVSRGDSYAELGQYEMAIQEYDEAIRLERGHHQAYYKRGLAYEALGKPEEAARDFQKAKELEYNDDGGQSSGLSESGPATPIFLDDFTKITEVAPLVLEGEISGGFRYQSWSFEGNKGQILQFELRPKPESHIDFGHVRKTLFTGQGDSREGKEDAHFEVIARDEQLEEIELPYTGVYTLSFEGNPENSSGAYTITISRR